VREKTTKSDRIRTVPLTRRTVDALADLHAWHAPAPEARVFAAARGGIYRPGLFRSRVWNAAVRDAGLTDVLPHDLRHSAITAWMEHGAQSNLAAQWAGHSDPGFTHRRYGHVTPLHAVSVMDRLDAR
jgi:integrase